MKFEAGRDFALAMTARDPLADYRNRFHIPKTPRARIAYICAAILSACSRKQLAVTSKENSKIGPSSAWKAIFTRKILGCHTTRCSQLPPRIWLALCPKKSSS